MASSSPTDLSMKQSTIPLQMPPQSLGSGQPLPMQANTQIPIGPGQVPNIPLQVNSQLQNAQNHQGTISMQQQQQQQQVNSNHKTLKHQIWLQLRPISLNYSNSNRYHRNKASHNNDFRF